MKIAILTPGGVDRSGCQRIMPCLLWLVERLAKSGDEVHVFALRQEAGPGHWPLLGAQVHNAGGPNPVSRGVRILAQLLAEHRHGSFDVIHALWAVPQGVLAALAGKALGVPVLLHLPGGDLVNLPEIAYGGRLTFKGRMGLRVAVAGADRVVTPSAFMVRQAHELDIPAERVPFGVALDHWPVMPPRRRQADEPAKLLHVANLNPVKDQETLLMTAFQLCAKKIPFVLDIIGQDTLHGAVQRRSHELRLDEHVHFNGFLPQHVLKEKIYSADLLVVTSRHEAGPIVALEAASAGVPTVGTNVGLLADWSPSAARVVVPGDHVGLAREISDLLSHEDQRLRIAAHAQEKVIAEDADTTTRLFRDIYFELVARKNMKHSAPRLEAR